MVPPSPSSRIPGSQVTENSPTFKHQIPLMGTCLALLQATENGIYHKFKPFPQATFTKLYNPSHSFAHLLKIDPTGLTLHMEPIHVNLYHSRIVRSPMCFRCHSHEETLAHALFGCSTVYQPPPPGQLKLNVDATQIIQKNRMGFGLIVRNHTSDIVASLATPWKGVHQPLMMEAHSLQLALEWCQKHSLMIRQIEFDCQILVDVVIKGFALFRQLPTNTFPRGWATPRKFHPRGSNLRRDVVNDQAPPIVLAKASTPQSPSMPTPLDEQLEVESNSRNFPCRSPCDLNKNKS
ncbi:hypothetical protein F8388_015978 [Cannabis sativa]|uniref:RNase H type-1 domain-containing protein n=1 Tax=Cannabis sativa TaxID=3483 RepID=A0A7J6EBL0_CANSA|nr:hypothetical protein G4B88_019930 [Cannabis sativa]KAF4360109.1 hypothetical protein F8388_015978 [Cannabis sativa]